jgi:hypothetical protein
MTSKWLLCAALVTACAASPGFRRSEPKDPDPIITIDAGDVAIRNGSAWAYYLIDQHARLCYFLLAADTTAVDCCALTGYPTARPYLPWCAAPDAVGPPGSPPPPAAPPPAAPR